MGLFVEILSIGPFERTLVEYYEYPADRYVSVQPGTPIVTVLFGIVEGTSAGKKIAQTVGISNVYDFNKHQIDIAKIDFAAMEETLSALAGWEEGDQYKNDLASLKAFARHGYDLYLIPNF